MGPSNLLVAMTLPIAEFKIRVFVESLRELSPKVMSMSSLYSIPIIISITKPVTEWYQDFPNFQI